MKPFIKPRPSKSTATPPPPPPSQQLTPGELSILTLAAAIKDAAERSIYLDRACRGDEILRHRIEERLAANAETTRSEEGGTPAVIRPQQLSPHPQPGQQAVALVPMSAAQLANAAGPAAKPNTIPWFAATLLAAVAGALGVLFSMERANRAKADLSAIEAQGESAEARQQRIEAEAVTLEARTAAERSAQAQRDALQQRDAAVSAAENEKRQRAQAEARMKEAEAAAAAAREEVQREKSNAASGQATANSTLADTFAKLASAQLDTKNYPAAAESARRSLELRNPSSGAGWPSIETRAVLAIALFQTNQDADAEREFLAATAAVDPLGKPATEPDKAGFAAATKRILQFFTVTGRRKDGAEWRKKLELLAKP